VTNGRPVSEAASIVNASPLVRAVRRRPQRDRVSRRWMVAWVGGSGSIQEIADRITGIRAVE
jgi:hypothetical protein